MILGCNNKPICVTKTRYRYLIILAMDTYAFSPLRSATSETFSCYQRRDDLTLGGDRGGGLNALIL
jgi:hypothetical protein